MKFEISKKQMYYLSGATAIAGLIGYTLAASRGCIGFCVLPSKLDYTIIGLIVGVIVAYIVEFAYNNLKKWILNYLKHNQ